MQKFIITGSSKGIGRALTLRALQEPGITVTGISRSPVDIDLPGYHHLQLDLADLKKILSKVDKIFDLDDSFDRVVLINNAGYLGEVKHTGNINSDEYSRVYSVNLTAPAILMNEFIRAAHNKVCEKIIINISSGAGRKSDYDGWSAYSSSKAAMDRLSEVVAREFMLDGKDFKIRSLAPGVVETQMQETLRQSSGEDFSNLDKFNKLKLEGTLASPSDVADRIMRFIDQIDDFPEILQDLRLLNL